MAITRRSTLMAYAALIFCLPGTANARPSAEQVVANYILALGGSKAVASVKTIIVRGIYSEGTMSFDATVARMRPFYKLVGDPLKRSKDYEEGYDGSAWEFYGRPGIVLRTVGAPAAATRHSTAVLGALADYRGDSASIELLGSEVIAGRKAWQIRLRMRDGYRLDDFIDAANWRLTGERQIAQIHAVGDKVRIERRFGDFRTVDGITIPFETSNVNIATGAILNRFVVRSVTLNQHLDPSHFSPPAFTRTPRQSLIETLFTQRDDPDTLRWTLFDFRRAHTDTSTDEPCRIAGYQMVKAGAFSGAIALLKQNEKDYPASAAAASNLGRAYANAGKPKAATAERALELDPRDQRARAALEALHNP